MQTGDYNLLISKFRNIVNSKDRKRLLSNFMSLMSLQGANYILPLITLPYLVRVLGAEYFGLLAFATATTTYFTIISDYGFNLTATREISMHRDDKEKVTEIFSAVMTIKLILMFISFLLLCILVFLFDKFSDDAIVYFFSFGVVIGQVLFPVWFFQGMERMKYITYLNIFSKLIFIIAIFVFVHEQSDYYLVPLMTGIGAIVVGFWSLFLIKKEFEVKFHPQSVIVLKHYFFDGWSIFTSSIYVAFYTTANIFLLGIFTNNMTVGHYSIAEKIVNAVGGLFSPANQTIFPYISNLHKRDKEQFFSTTRKISIIFLSGSIFLFLLMYFFGDITIKIINGKENKEIQSIFNILIFTLITIPFGPLLTQMLVIKGESKVLNQVLKRTFMFNIFSIPIMIYFFDGVGLAFGVVFTQIFVIASCIFKLKG